MMRFSAAGSAREVSANPLISLRAGSLREVREVSANPLISLRGFCGREVPYYYVIGMVPSKGNHPLSVSREGAR